MIFAVCGGDERQARLVRRLMADGHRVRAFALEGAALPPEAELADEAREAVEAADCVVLPLPASGRRGYLNAPLASEEHCIGEVIGALTPGQLVCAGMPDARLREMAEACGAVLRDYYQREELLAVNAAATAEGAIGVLLGETDGVLWRKRILVTGWGRLGRALAPRLRALGAEVWVSARSSADRAYIEATGLRALDTDRLEGNLGGFDAVINTVPARVLDAVRLAELRACALVVDLASLPGGVDMEAAEAFGLRAVRALSLPGKWSPETAAEAVRDAVLAIMHERGKDGGEWNRD